MMVRDAGISTKSIKDYLCLVLLLCLPVLCFAAESPEVAVIYPDVREPYRGVFSNIINGIEARLGSRVMQHPLGDRETAADVNEWLGRNGVSTVVALGTRGLEIAESLGPKFHVVVGAVLSAPGELNASRGIVLTPNPDLLFARLRQLSPRTESITVIYNPSHSQWLIDLATIAAEKQGLRLEALPAKDFRQAAEYYRDVLDRDEGRRSAIWLPHDPSVDEQAILSLVLERAWQNSVVVFSSNPAHVRRGVLFSMFPDNEGMGRSLAEMALNQDADHDDARGKVIPLSDLLIAVNLRTAEHLGLSISQTEVREFDVVFPSR